MRDILLIAKREFLEQVRGKAFKVTTILIPVIFGAIIGISVFASKNSGQGNTSSSPPMTRLSPAAFAKNCSAIKTRTWPSMSSRPQPSPTDNSSSRKSIRSSSTAFSGSPLTPTPQSKATFVGRSSGDFATESRLSDALDHAIVQQRLSSHGIPAR